MTGEALHRRIPPARLVLTVAWGGMLLAGSLIPVPRGLGIGVSDTLLHGTLYGVFALLACWSLMPALGPVAAGPAALGVTLLFGGLTELLQLAVPWRSAEVRDLLADGLGAAVGVALLLLAHRARGAVRP